MSQSTLNTLEDIRTKFERVKSQISEKTGRKKSLMDRLEEELGIKSVDEIYDRLDKLEKEIEKRKAEKEKLITKVDELLSAVEE